MVVGCAQAGRLGILDVTGLSAGPPELAQCCQSHIRPPPPRGSVGPVCVNIFSIILRTFILVLSTALLALGHNNTGICWPPLAWAESTNNKLDICVYAELEILCNVLSRLELVRENREQMGGNQMYPKCSFSPCLFFKDMKSLS